MKKETSAGIKAGTLVSLLFTGGFFALLFAFIGITPLLGVRSLGISYMVFGILFFFVISAVFGAIAGLAFALLVNRLPIRSVYAKSLVMCLCLWLFFFLAVPTRIIIDILVLGLFVLEAFCFAYLFNEWTRAG